MSASDTARSIALALSIACSAMPALAQTGSGGPVARPEGPATPPRPGSQSGTAPGNEGSTGWTGGTGGSFTGTSNHAPTPGSRTDHPETVRGLNPPTGNPPPPSR